MAKGDLIRLGLFSILLVIVIGFYSNLGVLSFNNVNISETLPKPVKAEPTISGNNIPSITASVDNAKKLNLNFELVGIRGNSPQSTIIVLENSKYKLIEQGENITYQLVFSHTDGSRAYFFDGTNYTFLDIIGSETAFDKTKINQTDK